VICSTYQKYPGVRWSMIDRTRTQALYHGTSESTHQSTNAIQCVDQHCIVATRYFNTHTHTHIQELQTEQQPSSQSRCQIAIVQQASTQMMEQLQLAVRRMSTTTSTVAMLLDSNPTSVQATNNINSAIQHNAMAPIDDHTCLYQYDRSMHHQ
jgi:CTP:molybdopterin cytidylyltransferase MocA